MGEKELCFDVEYNFPYHSPQEEARVHTLEMQELERSVDSLRQQLALEQAAVADRDARLADVRAELATLTNQRTDLERQVETLRAPPQDAQCAARSDRSQTVSLCLVKDWIFWYYVSLRPNSVCLLYFS